MKIDWKNMRVVMDQKKSYWHDQTATKSVAIQTKYYNNSNKSDNIYETKYNFNTEILKNQNVIRKNLN